MPKRSTLDNVLLLTCLRFIGKETTAREIARFLKISIRHANFIINELIERGYCEHVGGARYYIKRLDVKGLEVISNILQYVSTLITPKRREEESC